MLQSGSEGECDVLASTHQAGAQCVVVWVDFDWSGPGAQGPCGRSVQPFVGPHAVLLLPEPRDNVVVHMRTEAEAGRVVLEVDEGASACPAGQGADVTGGPPAPTQAGGH